jgi:hypothetical protein
VAHTNGFATRSGRRHKGAASSYHPVQGTATTLLGEPDECLGQALRKHARIESNSRFSLWRFVDKPALLEADPGTRGKVIETILTHREADSSGRLAEYLTRNQRLAWRICQITDKIDIAGLILDGLECHWVPSRAGLGRAMRRPPRSGGARGAP